MKIRSRISAVVTSFIVLLIGSFAFPVFAQLLEEVVVTAQRREQTALDVPVSLEVISGNEVLQEGFRSVEHLSGYSPSLDIDGSIHGQSIRIRGIGTEGNNLALEQSVPIFLDGNHLGRGEQVYSAFLDVQRVEVLRGPQPVFFGQNASAGAVSITSMKPTSDWEGHITGEAGNNSAQMVEFGVGGPVSDTVGIRVAGKYDKNAGWMFNTLNSSKFPAQENLAARFTLAWRATDALNVTAVVGYSDISNGGRAVTPVGLVPGDDTGYSAIIRNYPSIQVDDRINNVGMTSGPPFLPIPNDLRRGFTTPNSRLVDLSRIATTEGALPFTLPSYTEIKPWNTYVTLEYEFANGIFLESQTSYSDLKVDYVRHTRPEGFPLNTIRRAVDEIQYSQELRLSSPADGTIEWATGVYWQDNKRDELAQNINPDFLGNLHSVRQTIATENARWASAFAMLTFNYENFSLDAGGRYTDVKKDAVHAGGLARYIVEGGGQPVNHRDVAIGITAFTPFPNVNNEEYSESMFNPQVVLRYRATDSINFYARYAEAFKAGGYDTSVIAVVPADDFVLNKEVGTSWESGVKGTFFDNTVSAEVIGFWTEFSDLQVSSFDEAAGRQRTLNAAKQRVRGFEINGQWVASERLSFGLSGSIQDGTMLAFPGANCTRIEVDAGLCVSDIPGRIDRSGQDAIRTPDFVFNLRVNYNYPIFDQYRLSFSGLFRYSDEYIRDYDKVIIQDDTFNTNLTLGFSPEDDKWRLSLFGRNLTNPTPTYKPENNRSIRTLELDTNQNMFRTYGVQFKYNIF